MSNAHLNHSDYIVYVDESGDHSTTTFDEAYPVFVLTFCVFLKADYAHVITPAIRMLKFATFGHDMVILHENDIRKKLGAFKMLNKEKREAFLEKLHALVAETNVIIFATIVDKHKIVKQHLANRHIYHLAMQMGLEKLFSFLQVQNQADRLTHVICEARGRMEDVELALEFMRVCSGDNSLQQKLPFEIVIADKKSNSEGLQFADMVARPIGLSSFRPQQFNRAMTIIDRKLHRNGEGVALGHGLDHYP